MVVPGKKISLTFPACPKYTLHTDRSEQHSKTAEESFTHWVAGPPRPGSTWPGSLWSSGRSSRRTWAPSGGSCTRGTRTRSWSPVCPREWRGWTWRAWRAWALSTWSRRSARSVCPSGPPPWTVRARRPLRGEGCWSPRGSSWWRPPAGPSCRAATRSCGPLTARWPSGTTAGWRNPLARRRSAGRSPTSSSPAPWCAAAGPRTTRPGLPWTGTRGASTNPARRPGRARCWGPPCLPWWSTHPVGRRNHVWRTWSNHIQTHVRDTYQHILHRHHHVTRAAFTTPSHRYIKTWNAYTHTSATTTTANNYFYHLAINPSLISLI